MSTPARPSPPPAPPRRPRFRFSWRLALLFVALLAVNYWIGSKAMHSTTRIRVPYSPFFLDEVKKGDVVSITSQGTVIQGTF